MTIWFSFTVILNSVVHFVAAQPLTQTERAAIDGFVQGVMSCKGIPGLSLAAVRGAEVVLAEGYGIKNIDGKQPVTRDTLFGIGSITKQFTSILLSKLMSQRRLNWNTPVRDIVGEDFYMSSGFRSNKTCLRDLLSHKTGVPRNDLLWMLEAFPDRNEIINRLRFYEPLTDMRTAFIYNNIMYLTAGWVAEKLTSTRYEELIRKELYDQLMMTASTFVDDVDSIHRFATPYFNRSGVTFEMPFTAFRATGLAAPSGSIASSATDMGIWLVFLLTGIGPLGEVMRKEQIASTWVPDAFGSLIPDSVMPIKKPLTPETWSQYNYGKGFTTGYYRGHKMVLHPGDLLGYHSFLAILPDRNIGVYVAVNQNDVWDRRLIPLHVLDILTGDSPWLNVSYACNDFPPSPENLEMFDIQQHLMKLTSKEIPKQVAPMSRPDSDYIGIYGNFGYGNVTVVSGGQYSNITLFFGRTGVFELLPIEGDTFAMLSVGEAWYLNLGFCTFSSSTEGLPCDELVIPYLEITKPPVFRRNLKMSDAPPPRADTC